MKKRKNKFIFLGITALIIGGLFSLFASGSPDGLEKVAEDQNFISAALDFPINTVMPEYTFPIENEWLATSLAGLIGTIFTFLILLSIGKILAKFR